MRKILRLKDNPMPPLPPLVLAHGWSYEAHFWDKLLNDLALFRPLPPLIRQDRGYNGPVALMPFPQTPFWAIGHSAGVMDILAQLSQDENALHHCLGVISFNGFACFAQKPDFPEGVPPRLLQRMRRKLSGATQHITQNVVQDFRKICGQNEEEKKQIFHAERLEAGLQRLEDLDLRPALSLLAHASCPLYSITGSNDPLSPASSGFGLAARQELCMEGGHLLPFFQSQACAEHLNTLLSSSH